MITWDQIFSYSFNWEENLLIEKLIVNRIATIKNLDRQRLKDYSQLSSDLIKKYTGLKEDQGKRFFGLIDIHNMVRDSLEKMVKSLYDVKCELDHLDEEKMKLTNLFKKVYQEDLHVKIPEYSDNKTEIEEICKRHSTSIKVIEQRIRLMSYH